MLTVIAALIGGLLGFRRARALGGNRKDRAHYAVGYAIAFGLTATIAGIFIGRLIQL